MTNETGEKKGKGLVGMTARVPDELVAGIKAAAKRGDVAASQITERIKARAQAAVDREFHEVTADTIAAEINREKLAAIQAKLDNLT